MGFFDKIFSGLTKTRRNLEELEEIFRDYAPDNEDFYEELEELLVMADVGAATAENVVKGLKKMTWERRFRYGDEARAGLVELLTRLLNVGSTDLKLDTRPSVILMVGVNGVGKTTTIGKLAHQLREQGIPSAPRQPSSWASGRSAPGRISSATRRAATLPPWCMTASAPPKPEGRTWSSSTPPAGSTTSRI